MSLPEKKHNLSSFGIQRKVNPYAPQHSGWSRPAEGRKKIPTAPPKKPKPKAKQNPKPKPTFIGNQEYFADSIVFEDAAPFNKYNEFFSIEGGKFDSGPNAKGAMLTLTSDSSFLNQTGIPLSTLDSNQGVYVFQCLRRLAQYLLPQEYKILPKNHSKIMMAAENRYKDQIKNIEDGDINFFQTEEFVPDGEHFDLPKEKQRLISNKEELNIPKRTKCLKAAIIDTDGALLEELFKSQKFSLQYRKIITTNDLLQRFFQNIHYWGVNDHKYLLAINPNFETSEYTGLKIGMTFEDFGKRILSCTLGYGISLPPFFRNFTTQKKHGLRQIYEFIDKDADIQIMLTNEFQTKMYGVIPHEYYKQHEDKYPLVSSTYCEHVYSSFYASKTNRETKTKTTTKFPHFQVITEPERAALYSGDEFIQCYKIKKISDDEIKVERLKV